MFLLLLQIFLAVLYYVALPSLAAVPAIVFFLPALWFAFWATVSGFLLTLGVLIASVGVRLDRRKPRAF